MTRIFQRPNSAAPGEACTRALVIGAGRYPYAKVKSLTRPSLIDLESVGVSVLRFVSKLIRDWRDELIAPLESVDFLVSDTAYPNGSTWSALGVDGEVPNGTNIHEATLGNVKTSLSRLRSEGQVQDHFLFLCCGHGFWKSGRCFVLSDFGMDSGNPWTSTIALDSFTLGLRQEKPRHLWLFFDCCSDMPDDVLQTLGQVGDPLIQPTAAALAAANTAFGTLESFGLASSSVGAQAFGVPGMPSRFCEVLSDALDGAGAVSWKNGHWWIDDRGIQDAVNTYAQRHPELSNPEFYQFPTPISSDASDRLLLRRIKGEPMSHLVAFSKPPIALKHAEITITAESALAPYWTQTPPGSRAKLHIDLPPRKSYIVAAIYNGIQKKQETYASLPLADEVEFSYE